MVLPKIKKAGYIIIALLGITLVVVVHEFGHFLACKLFNVRTPVFSIGFNPELISHKIGSTSFQIGALPLGGYVSINQLDFSHLPYIKKMIIILAGILFNILFSMVVYSFLSWRSNLDMQEHNQENIHSAGDNNKSYLNNIKKILKKQKRSLIGPIGVISLISQSAALGIDSYFYFLSIISLNLAFFNVLPLPFLDGGQAFEITLATLFGQNVGQWAMYLIYLLFFVIVWTILSRKKSA